MKDNTFIPGQRAFSTGQLAKAADRNPSTVWRDIQSGELPARRVGPMFVIDERDAALYLAHRRAEPKDGAS